MNVPVNTPLLEGNEKKYLNECIDTGWISSEGPFITKFEAEFSRKMGRRAGIAVANGSVALDAAVVALGIGKGDEVILPSFTIISCLASVVRAGAVPVFVDSDPVTWNMDVTRIEEKITSRTKAIMVVHIYGLPVDMDPVLGLAKKNGLKIIEDAAEMHGQTYKGKPCGSFGDISTFSFYPNKHVTTGEGGMILCDESGLEAKCRSLRNLCFIPERRFVHEELGYNFRMTNLQAAMGVAQLEQLDKFIDMKRNMGRYYREQLAGLTEYFDLPLSRTDFAENIYWVFGLVLKENNGLDATQIMAKLAAEGVGTRPFFWGMHEQPVLKKLNIEAGGEYPVAERLARKGFYLPSGLGLTLDQQNYVIEKVKKVVSKL